MQRAHRAASPRSWPNGTLQAAHHGGPMKRRLDQQVAQKR
jgi:hypothetical protein